LLLKNRDDTLYEMVQQTGSAMTETLSDMAQTVSTSILWMSVHYSVEGTVLCMLLKARLFKIRNIQDNFKFIDVSVVFENWSSYWNIASAHIKNSTINTSCSFSEIFNFAPFLVVWVQKIVAGTECGSCYFSSPVISK
jgi:hypothetical protein